MKINITGKDIKLTRSLKSYVLEKISKLEKYLSSFEPVNIDVKLHSSGKGKGEPRSTVECTITVPDNVFRCEEVASDMYGAIDIAQEKMERKLRQIKEKNIDKRKRRDRDSIPSFGYLNAKELKKMIKKRKTFDLGVPIDESEAISRMELLGHDFYVYIDAESRSHSTVYKRKDGGYGIIQEK